MRRITRLAAALIGMLASGCAVMPPDAHVPPYAKVPYAPFSREAAIQIALREWRGFGQPVIQPGTELPGDGERADGLWQRVGDYWWLGLDAGEPEEGWTGIHDGRGRLFPEGQDGTYAWSAAFISYVMRMAGAGKRFPYAANHSRYINAARTGGSRAGLAVTAERLQDYAPQRGDLICLWRGRQPIRFEDLSVTPSFPAHCDIVVGVSAGRLDVIGGNVDNAVSMKHVPVGGDGRLAGPDGIAIDHDHNWLAVLRVAYER